MRMAAAAADGCGDLFKLRCFLWGRFQEFRIEPDQYRRCTQWTWSGHHYVYIPGPSMTITAANSSGTAVADGANERRYAYFNVYVKRCNLQFCRNHRLRRLRSVILNRLYRNLYAISQWGDHDRCGRWYVHRC